MTRPALTAALCVLGLVGCKGWPGGTQAAGWTVIEQAAPVAEQQACPVLDSRDWEAWVNKMPGPGAVATIHVVGKVDVRSGGYTFSWEEGPMDRSAVPALRLKLVPKAPDGMATMAVATEAVKYQAPALSSGYSRVVIGCGGTTLAEITEIMDVY